MRSKKWTNYSNSYFLVEFWYEYRKENTPEVNDEELTSLGDEAKNERLIKLYKDTYERSKPATTEKLPPNPPTTTTTTTTKSNKKLVDLKVSPYIYFIF